MHQRYTQVILHLHMGAWPQVERDLYGRIFGNLNQMC